MKAVCQGTAATSKLKHSSTLPNTLVCACRGRDSHSAQCRRRQHFLCYDRNLWYRLCEVCSCRHYKPQTHIPESKGRQLSWNLASGRIWAHYFSKIEEKKWKFKASESVIFLLENIDTFVVFELPVTWVCDAVPVGDEAQRTVKHSLISNLPAQSFVFLHPQRRQNMSDGGTGGSKRL